MDIINLQGKKGLVVGIANDKSIAYGCARIFRQAGAELAVTYLNEKAEPHVRPLAQEVGASIILPCNVLHENELANVFKVITEKWGKMDFLLHSIAYAPKEDLAGRVVDVTSAGFKEAIDVSCYSFIHMCRLAEPLMQNGGSALTVSYYGSEKVVRNYNIMGPVKAALEASTRYMAAELGEKNIRVNALSPGPVMTRAASGISHFEDILHHAKEKSPLHQLVTLDDIGHFAAFLVSDAAQRITGNIHYIDAGYGVVD